MKFINYCLLTTFMLVTVVQIGCLSGGAMKTADKLVEAKDYRGAIEVYQNVVNTKPGTVDAREAQLAIGKLYIERMNRPAQGVKAYEAIIAEAPESEEAAEAHYRLGMHHYRQKDFETAQTQFDTIINQFPHLELSHGAHLMLAKSYEEGQKYEKAVEAFDSFANRNPQSERAAQALINKARIQRDLIKDDDEAKRTLQFTVKKYGSLDAAKSHIDKAKEELTELNASIPEPEDPEDTQIGRALKRQQERREMDRPRGGVEKSRAMGAKVAAEDSGFGISAEEVMKNFGGETAIAGDEQGSYHDAELMIAGFFYGDENYRDAGALYFDAIARAEAEKVKIDPHNYLRLSICYRKLGMHQRAAKVLKKASSKDSKVIDAVISTGQNQHTNEEYEKALETFNSVVGLNRNKDAEIYWFIGKTYEKLGDSEKEREAFEQAVAKNPEDTDALQSLAEVLHYRLKDRKTAGIFQDIIEQKGNSFITMKTLGDVCYKYKEYSKAQIKYKAAARIAKRLLGKSENPAEKQILTHQYGYGTILAVLSIFKQGSEADAQTLLDTLAGEYPEHPLLPYAKGEIALLKGDEKVAIDAFKEAMEKDPRSDIPVIALGDYYVSKGYNDDAITLWENYLEKDKYNAKVLRRLKPLKANGE
ncbi:MAG: tetratricopeptide repeat protein [Candidatus Poribacteria bacterium]|nr:tetratricopeptide repeat protein [Candidatus Poribacteria bacterium]